MSDKKRALLVIDVQKVYFSEGPYKVVYPTGALQNVLAVMDAANAKNIPVIVVKHMSDDPKNPFHPSSPLSELLPEISSRQHTALITKKLPGSYYGTELGKILQTHGVNTVVISGFMTQMCCDTTSRQSFHRRLSVEFLSDATGAINLPTATAEEVHRVTLATQGMMFAKILTAKEWIASL